MAPANTSTAKYIVIDGIDGGGKGSLFKSLQDVFPQLPSYSSHESVRLEGVVGKYFSYTREPGGTPLGEKLRGMILSDEMSSFSEMCLLLAQRQEVRKRVVAPAFFAGINVLSDRSDSATFAYQIRGRELGHLEKIFWEMREHMDPFPTLYLFLDLDPRVAAQRMIGRQAEGPEADKFEKQNIEFFEKVRKGFIDFASKVDVPCKYVNAERSKEEVAAEVIEIINQHLGRAIKTPNENVVPISVHRA